MKLSLVVPCYNEEGNIRAFYTEAKRVFDAEDYEYEIIFVNDGSRDKTQEELEKVYNLHETNIVIEMFSRNFGKEAAIYAGFQKASGDLVTVAFGSSLIPSIVLTAKTGNCCKNGKNIT